MKAIWNFFFPKKNTAFIDDLFHKHSKNLSTKKKEEDSAFYEDLVNIIIIYLDGRPSCLLESANYKKHEWTTRYFPKLKKIIKELKLTITKDRLALKDYPRYFISKNPISPPSNENQVAQLLGFTRSGNYSDYKIPRHRLSINTTFNQIPLNLFTQIVIDRNIRSHKKAIHEMAQHWQDVWNKHTILYPLEFKLEMGFDHGTLKREKKLREHDSKYLQKHADDYENDFWNFSQTTDSSIPFSSSNYSTWLTMYQQINK